MLVPQLPLATKVLLALLAGCTPLAKRAAREGEHLGIRDSRLWRRVRLLYLHVGPWRTSAAVRSRESLAGGEGCDGSRCIKIEHKARVAGLRSEVF